MSEPIDPAQLRLQAKIGNERLKSLCNTLSNGGLALITVGIGFIWVSGSTALNWALVFVGLAVILVGLGLLDFMRAED